MLSSKQAWQSKGPSNCSPREPAIQTSSPRRLIHSCEERMVPVRE
jgi:hypothetical protein